MPAETRKALKGKDAVALWLKGNITAESENEMRQDYASKAYGFVGFWSKWVLVLILIDGLFASGLVNFVVEYLVPPDPAATEPTIGNEFLTDQVVLALVGAATVNVLAAFLAVIRSLFPKGGNDQQGQ
ncbi:MAG: hypothetical protein OIF57_05730 [Marinobacterium sp.]|nr:hypothetical protein [Marinobacterium sp.]